MNRILFSAVILFWSLVFCAQVPLNGLIGAWTFSGNANDVSGNNNNGTVFGASLTADRCGNPNSAYSFNGINNYIQMMTTGPTGTVSRSISFWAKTTNTVISPVVAFDYGTATGNGDSYQIVWNYTCPGVGLDLSNQALIRGNNCLLNGTWHHIVAVYNSSVSTTYSTVVYYIDGVQVPLISCNVSGINATINTGLTFPITIGRGATSAVRYFNGVLDDFYLYNRPLTQSEVLQLYNVMACSPPVTGSVMVCPGSVNVYSVSPVSGASYTWNLPSGWSGSSNTNTISTTAGVSGGTISVAMSSSCGALGNASLQVTVLPAPSLTLSSSNPVICNSAGATLTALGGLSYTWQPGSASGSTLAVNPLSSTVYTVTASGGSCTASATLSQLVASSLSISISSSNPVICSGSSVTLTATGGNSYTWQPGGTGGNSVVVSPGITSTYTVVATSTAGCTGSASFVQTVNPSPLLNINPASVQVCAGSAFTVNASGAASYTWYPGGINTSSFSALPLSNSVYTVTGTSAAGCSGQQTLGVVVNALPALSFSQAAISCSALGTATVAASGGTGPYSFTWTPVVQTGSVASGLFPGTYTVNVFDNGSTCSNSAAVYFPAAPPLSATVNASDSVYCYGSATGTAGIAVSGGSGSQSYSWTSAQGSQNTAVASGLSAGVHTVTITDLLTFCTVTRTFQILQPAISTLSISAGSASVCVGGSIQLVASSSGGSPGYTYTWQPGPSSATMMAYQPAAGNYTYFVSSQDARACLLTASVSLSFVPVPVISVSSVSVCPQQPGLLAAQGAATYTWNTGSQQNVLIASPLSTTPYTVTGTALGCTASATGTIFVKSAAVAIASGNSPVCEGDTIVLQANPNAGYLWSGPSGFTSALQNPLIPGSLPAQAGTYTLKVTAANGCTASAFVQVTVNPVPVLSAGGGTVCQGQPLFLWAGYQSNVSYAWTGPGGFTSSAQSFSISPGNTSHSGVYHVTITANGSGCFNTASVQALVVPPPVPAVIGNTSVCAGAPLSMTASGGTSYQWLGPGNFSSNQTTITLSNMMVGGTMTLFVSQGPCVTDTLIPYVVNALPTLSIGVSGNNPACEGTSIQLSALSGQAASSYTWTGPGNTPRGNVSPLIISSLTLSDSGTYKVQMSDQNSCRGTASLVLGVLPAPVAQAQDLTVCAGERGLLKATGGVGYAWSGPGGFVSLQAVAVIDSVSLQHAGIYTVIVTGNNGCNASAIAQLSVNPFALPQPVAQSMPRTACIHGEVVLSGEGGTTYSWAGPKGYVASGKTVTLLVTGSDVGGIYTLTVRNESNCAASATLAINPVAPAGAILSSQHNKVCVPFCAELSLKPVPPGPPLLSHSLQVNSEYIGDSVSVYCFSRPGSFAVKLSYTDSNYCVNSSTMTIEALPKPEADYNYHPERPVAGIDEVQFFSASLPQYLQHQWFLTLSGDTVRSRNFNKLFQQAGNYPVTLLVTNQYGCSDTITRIISVADEFSLYVPNAFSPNADGLNDVFAAKGQGIESFSIEIFNRWGENIFSSNDIYKGWDGTYKSVACKSDSYVWKISIVNSQRQTRHFTGHVNLIR